MMLEFYKMTGAEHDFVMVDNRELELGSALTAGIPMLPAFRGTGYDANQRTQLDYGSNLYIIEG